MINEEKINYLNSFKGSNDILEILNHIDVTNMEDNIISTIWKKIFSQANKDIRIEKLMNIWQQHVGKEFENVISFLNNSLVDVELMKLGNKYSVLYSIKVEQSLMQDEGIIYYKGGNPLDKLNNEQLKEDWHKMPAKIKEFYGNVHNGFYEFETDSMGLEDFNEVHCLDDYEWGILDEIGGETLQLDFKTSYDFFTTGGGDYVVIDYKNCENDNATIWSSKEEPIYNVKFWGVVDKWICVNFGLDFDIFNECYEV